MRGLASDTRSTHPPTHSPTRVPAHLPFQRGAEQPEDLEESRAAPGTDQVYPPTTYQFAYSTLTHLTKYSLTYTACLLAPCTAQVYRNAKGRRVIRVGDQEV